MYIPRHIESVVARMAKRKPVIVLTGARQVGKTHTELTLHNNKKIIDRTPSCVKIWEVRKV